MQDAANQRRDLDWEQRVLTKDEAVVQINLLLASRAQHIFQSDKDEGPQVVFPAELQDGNRQTPREKRKSDPKVKKHGVPGKRRLPKVGAKPAKPRAGEPNKRQQLEALLTRTGSDTWVEGHRSRDNLCITCSTCGFFVEQVDSRVSFDKKVRHTCEWREPSASQMGEHPSYQMVNGGRMWLCRLSCSFWLSVWLGAQPVARSWRKVLKARHQGKLVTNQRSHLLNQHKDMVQHQAKETCLLEPRLHAGTTPTAQASVNVRLVKPGIPLPESLRLEKRDPKGMPKAKKEKAKSKKKEKEKGGKRPGKDSRPQC